MTSLLLSLTLMLLPQVRRPLDGKEIGRLTERSEIIVAAEVAEVEPTDMQQPWTGLITSKQFVQYNIREVLKGEVSDAQIRVGFMLFQNSLTADKDQPRLSPELFRKGNVHILFLKRGRRSPAAEKKRLPWLNWLSYDSVDSDYGAVMAAPAVEAKVRAVGSAPKAVKAKERP